MNLETLREACLAYPRVTEDFPFDESVLAFRVNGKIFLLTNVDDIELSFNVKCEPARAIELRETYAAVKPGYHMSKKHWNTVTVDGSIPDDVLLDFVRHSFDRVVAGMTKRDQHAIAAELTQQS